ncbi:MAG: metal ABC transporter ATP-binding protein [Rickettsiaceae bacterium]
MNNIVEFVSISKKFNSKSVIDNVSFNIKRSDITTIIGPNGVGKTTIVKLILGLLKQDSGSIKIPQQTKIEYVPQKFQFSNQLPMSVESFLELLAFGYDVNSDLKLFSDFIDIEGIRHLDISRLSSGQLQKLVIVGALLNKPDFIILDEPVQFLDINSQQEFYNLIHLARNNMGMTILMISHDLYTVMKCTDKVICFNGHVCCSGKPINIDLVNKKDPFADILSQISLYQHHHDHKH